MDPPPRRKRATKLLTPRPAKLLSPRPAKRGEG
jgi:hypothetical protein